MKTKPDALAAYYRDKYPLTFAVGDDSHRLKKRYQEAWDIAKEAALILKRDFGAEKVVLFGSLTDFSRFTQWSDVDLAVWGLPDNRFFAAVATISSLASAFSIDLIDVKDCKEFIRIAVETEGIEI